MNLVLVVAGVWVLCLIGIVALLGYVTDDLDEQADVDAPLHVANRDWVKVSRMSDRRL